MNSPILWFKPPRRFIQWNAFKSTQDRLAFFIATAAGAGLAPLAPGTAGALVGLPLIYFTIQWPLLWQLLFWSILTLIGTWAAQRFDDLNGTEDNQNTVIDETVGVGITALACSVFNHHHLGPRSIWLWASFVLFRLFDIWKPWPVRLIDDWSHSPAARKSWLGRWAVGFGVMADDVVAGIQGFLVLWALLHVPLAFSAEKTLFLHHPTDRLSFDWQRSTSRADGGLNDNIQIGLFHFDAGKRLIADFADQWHYSSDFKKITVKLKPNQKWSDGTALISQHFCDGYTRLLNPSLQSSAVTRLFSLLNAEAYYNRQIDDLSLVGFRCPNALTIEFKLTEANPSWIKNLTMSSMSPIRKDLIAKFPDSWLRVGNLVTTGPFKLVSYTEGKEFILEKNPFFKLYPVQINRVVYKITPDDEAIELLKSGKLDGILKLSRTQEKKITGLKNLNVYYGPYNRFRKLEINRWKFPTQLPELRKAIAHALDRKAFELEFNHVLAAEQFIPPNMNSRPKKNKALTSDLLLAKNEMKKIKISLPPLDLLVAAFDENHDEQVRLAKMIVDRMKKELGLNINAIICESQQQYALLRESQSYHLLLRDYNISNVDSLDFFDGYTSTGRYKDLLKAPEYDKLIKEAALKRLNPKTFDSFLEQIEEELSEYYVVIPLFFLRDAAAFDKKIGGFDGNRWDLSNIGTLRFTR